VNRRSGRGEETSERLSGAGGKGIEGSREGEAYGSEVGGVGEEDSPAIADPFVELDRTLGRLGLEIGGDRTEAEGWHLRVWMWYGGGWYAGGWYEGDEDE
jgi:hypothetical protein